MTTQDIGVGFSFPPRARVFPILPNSKKPSITEWQKRATDKSSIIEQWFTNGFAGHNYGVATGRGMIVVDCDGEEGMQSLELLDALGLPEGYRVSTPSGGMHVYLLVDEEIRNSAKQLENYPGIDIRGDGGYVVGPGSTIEKGAWKHVAGELRDYAPEWLLVDLRKRAVDKQHSSVPVIDLDQPNAIRRAIEYLKHRAPVAKAGEGGNNVTYTVAAQVRHFGISEGECFDLMGEHWNEAGKAEPPWAADELQGIIHNAYQYATGAWGGESGQAEFGDATTEEGFVEAVNAPENLSFSLLEGKERSKTYTVDYLIENVINRKSLAIFYGPSGSGKSFLLMDMAFHIAAGLPWNRHQTKKGAVLYVATEGGLGILKRCAALCDHYNVTEDVPLYFMTLSVDFLRSAKDIKKVINEARRIAEQTGIEIQMVAIDTLARAMAGGDENSSTDMGQFVKNVDALQEKLQCTIALVHHTGKDVARGARGWSGLRAALDTEIEILDNTIRISKQRDIEPIEDMRFRLKKVADSCVIDFLEPNEFIKVGLTPTEKRILAVFKEFAHGDEPINGSDVRAQVVGKGICTSQHFSDCVTTLIRSSELKRVKKNQYLIGSSE